jgi:hypothetical protein
MSEVSRWEGDHLKAASDRRWDYAASEHRWDYKVRVRGTVYLWGSAGVQEGVTFLSPVLLHIRNDPFGEPITFGTQTAGGPQTTLGTLQAGEQFSIPIQQISGVFATCAFKSTVTCWFRHP